MLKLACSDAIIPGDSWTEKAEIIQKLGFVGISIFTPYESFNSSLLKELQCLEKNTGIKPIEFVFSSDMYGKLLDDDMKTRNSAFSLYEEAVKVCDSIGAMTEIEYEYRIQNPIPLYNPYPQASVEKEQQLVEVMERLCSKSNNNRVTILLEPCNRYECKHIKRISEAKRIVNMVSCENAGILADTFHLSIEENDLPYSILEGGNLIKHVHLGDNNRLLPGQGSLQWKKILRSFKQIHYEGYMTLECSIAGDAIEELSRFVYNFQNLWATV